MPLLLGGNRLVSVVSRAVGEEVVDKHADNWEEEDNESPDDLVAYGAVALEDLNCGTNSSAYASQTKRLPPPSETQGVE